MTPWGSWEDNGVALLGNCHWCEWQCSSYSECRFMPRWQMATEAGGSAFSTCLFMRASLL